MPGILILKLTTSNPELHTLQSLILDPGHLTLCPKGLNSKPKEYELEILNPEPQTLDPQV